tara:strand:- start:743 stop:1372 length:630 start_codon:yes stop_codon:yes gene_type:complete
MFLSPGNKQLLKQLGVPIWRLRKQPKQNNNIFSNNYKTYFYYNNTTDFFVSGQPSQSIDCLLLGEFSTITKNAPIDLLTDKSGALLYNMLKVADLLSYDLCFIDIQAIESVKNEKPLTLKTDRYSNSLFDQLRLISPKVVYAMGQKAIGLLTNSGTSVSIDRQKPHVIQKFGMSVLFSFDLFHLLQEGQDKHKAWEDLIFLREILGKHS